MRLNSAEFETPINVIKSRAEEGKAERERERETLGWLACGCGKLNKFLDVGLGTMEFLLCFILFLYFCRVIMLALCFFYFSLVGCYF